MTVRLPAWLQTGLYTAEHDRMVGTGLLTPSSPTDARGGVRYWSGAEYQVVPTSPATMQVTIKPGIAWVPGGYSPFQGVYAVLNDADVTLAISTANVTFPRIDLVVLEVLDQTYAGSANSGQLRIVQGTPAATPVVPTVVGSYIVLAQVRVSPTVSSIASTAITDVRPYAAAVGSTIPVNNRAQRLAMTGLPLGTEVREIDTNRIYLLAPDRWIYLQGGWVPDDEWIYPALLNGWSAYGFNFQPTRFRKTSAGQVELQVMAKFGSSTTALNLPAGYRPALRLIFAGRGGDPNCGVRWDIMPGGDVFVQMTDVPLTSNPKWASLSATFTGEQ